MYNIDIYFEINILDGINQDFLWSENLYMEQCESGTKI